MKNSLSSTKLFFEPKNGSEEFDFASMCRFIRETFNVTQAEMADKLGVGLSSYQRWEYGTREPSSKVAANLCFLYLQSLYVKKQSPKSTEIKMFLNSMLNDYSDTEKLQREQTSVAA